MKIQKERPVTIGKWETFYNNMQRIAPKHGAQVWHELINTYGQLVQNREVFDNDEYQQMAENQFKFIRSIIFQTGKERRHYIAGHIKDWPDVETQLNHLSNDRRIKLIFK